MYPVYHIYFPLRSQLAAAAAAVVVVAVGSGYRVLSVCVGCGQVNSRAYGESLYQKWEPRVSRRYALNETETQHQEHPLVGVRAVVLHGWH